MLEIWGRRNSGNVIPVMWAVGELGLDHVRHDVGGSFGGLDTVAYAAINPNRKVPTIRDGDLVLWESNAIIRYLSGRYGQRSLWPTDAAERAQADQWMEWLKTTAYPQFFPAFWGLVRTPADERNDAAIEKAVAALGRSLQIVDEWLANQRYLAGDDLTMGDIPLGAMIYRYYHLDIDRTALPCLDRWYERLLERPAYRQHVMIPFGTSPEEWQQLERAGANP